MHRIRLLAAPRLRRAAPGRAGAARLARRASSSARSTPAAATPARASTNDFVELFNAGAPAVDVNGWTHPVRVRGQRELADDRPRRVDPGRPLLPRPAELGRGDRRRAAGARRDRHDEPGRLRRQGRPRHRRDALACGARPGSCSGARDRRGLRRLRLGAADYEGSAARRRALSSSTAAVRAGGGCTDTDSNADDFSVGRADAAQLLGSRRRPARRLRRRRVPSQAARRRRRRPAGAVALARAPDDQLRHRRSPATTPAPISERVTVVSNNAAGYALTVHRTAFTPADLPLGLASTAPAGGTLGAVARRRRPGRDPDRARGRPGRSARHRRAGRRRRRLADDASASPVRCPPSLRGTTPRPSPTR